MLLTDTSDIQVSVRSLATLGALSAIIMSALTHPFDLSQATMLPDPVQIEIGGAEDLADQWDALHGAASAIGLLAQLAPEPRSEAVASLPHRVTEAGGEVFRVAAIGIADLVSVMQPGLQALLEMTSGGRDATGPALALWREFHMAREAILSLVPDECNEGSHQA